MGHYGNESEVVRELIRERQVREQEATREIEMIRAKLIQAEASGFTDQSPAEILKDIKSSLSTALPKNARGNISDKKLKALRLYADILLNYSKTELNKAVKSGELIEVVNNG